MCRLFSRYRESECFGVSVAYRAGEVGIGWEADSDGFGIRRRCAIAVGDYAAGYSLIVVGKSKTLLCATYGVDKFSGMAAAIAAFYGNAVAVRVVAVFCY